EEARTPRAGAGTVSSETGRRSEMTAGQTRRTVINRGRATLLGLGGVLFAACGVDRGGQGVAGGGKLAATLDVIIVPDPGEDPQHEQWVARFQQLNPGVKINLTLAKGEFASDYVSKVLAMVAANTPPAGTYGHPADLAGRAAKG